MTTPPPPARHPALPALLLLLLLLAPPRRILAVEPDPPPAAPAAGLPTIGKNGPDLPNLGKTRNPDLPSIGKNGQNLQNLGKNAPEAPDPTAALALSLARERQWDEAAIEYRRLALSAPDGPSAAPWFFAAAYAYAQSPDVKTRRRAPPLLDQAEDADPAAAPPVEWLRAELAFRTGDYDEAAFHFSALALDAPSPDWLSLATRGNAAATLLARGPGAASATLPPGAPETPDVLAAIDAYAAASPKKPWLGGILGLIPGLGYAYSGEYANALRSLLLNSLFIWAMTETAIEDQWALFGVSTFCEITWYSGSIYGGIDAAHRHNSRRAAAADDAIRTPTRPRPDLARLPLLVFTFP